MYIHTTRNQNIRDLRTARNCYHHYKYTIYTQQLVRRSRVHPIMDTDTVRLMDLELHHLKYSTPKESSKENQFNFP